MFDSAPDSARPIDRPVRLDQPIRRADVILETGQGSLYYGLQCFVEHEVVVETHKADVLLTGVTPEAINLMEEAEIIRGPTSFLAPFPPAFPEDPL